MIRILCLGLLLVIGEQHTWAQSLRRDSVQYWYQLGLTRQHAGDTEGAMQAHHRALDLCLSLNLADRQVDSYNQIGYLHYKWGDFAKAWRYFRRADSLGRRIAYPGGRAEALKNLAKYHHTRGEFEQSIAYNRQADTLAQAVQDTALQLVIRKNLGDDYESLGDYVLALRTYLAAQTLARQACDTLAISAIHSHRGNLYSLLGNLDTARLEHERALALREHIGYTEGIAKSLQNLGLILEQQGERQRAKQCFEASFVLCEQIGYRKGLIKCLNSLGLMDADRHDWEGARQKHRRALALARAAGYDKGVVIALTQLGQVAHHLQQAGQARERYLEALRLAQQDDLLSLAQGLYLGLYHLARSEGDLGQALNYFEAYHHLHDHLLGQVRSRAIAEVQVRYETAQKVKENELLRKENELQQLNLRQNQQVTTLLTVVALLSLGLALALYGRFRQKARSARSLASLNRQLNQANGEKDQFFAIIAHELRSPLWWLRNLTSLLSQNMRTLSPERLEKAIFAIDESAKNAVHLMDNLLQWSRTKLDRLTLQPRPWRISDLIKEVITPVQSAIDQKHLDLYLDLDPSATLYVDADSVKVVLRNLLSNAVKYTPEAGRISLRTQREGQGWRITVQDNGVGISADRQATLFDASRTYTTLGISQEKGSGLGLILCQEFVSRNGGSIRVESHTNTGTAFHVWLPGGEFEGQS